MYEPFEQAIDRYEEHPEHKKPLEVFEARLAVCSGCDWRVELGCTGCRDCGSRSLIRWAERLTTTCPKNQWPEDING